MAQYGVECLADSVTTHTVLYLKDCFITFTPVNLNLTTIARTSNLIRGHGIAKFMLSNGTPITVNDSLYSPESTRSLLSFKDIRENGYHVETYDESGIEYLLITNMRCGIKHVLEKLAREASGLYRTTIRKTEAHATYLMTSHSSEVKTSGEEKDPQRHA